FLRGGADLVGASVDQLRLVLGVPEVHLVDLGAHPVRDRTGLLAHPVRAGLPADVVQPVRGPVARALDLVTEPLDTVLDHLLDRVGGDVLDEVAYAHAQLPPPSPGPPCCCACWARSSGDGPNASSNARFHSFSSMPSRSLSHSDCCPPRPSVSSERPVSFQVCSISSPACSNDSRLQSGSKASGVNTSPQPCWAISSSEACGLPPIRALTPTFSDPATYWSCSHSVPAARPRRFAIWLASFTRARTPHSQRSQKSSKSVDRPWCPASIPVIDSPEKPLPMIEPVAPPNSPSPSMVAPTPLVNFATDAASRFRSTSSAATPAPLPVRAGVHGGFVGHGVHGSLVGHDPRDRREEHRPVLGRDVHRQTGRLPQPRHDLVHDPGPQQRRVVQRPFRHPALLREPGQ